MEEVSFQPHKITASEMQSSPLDQLSSKLQSGAYFAHKTNDDARKRKECFQSDVSEQNAFEAAELSQRGLVIQVHKSLTSNPISADKALVADSSTT